MTLRGEKNHYNVKYLRGYGFSIKVSDNKIILKDGLNPFTDAQESEEYFAPNLPYEKIVMCGKGYISTEALSLLSENYRNVILVDINGNPVTYLNPVFAGEGLTATQYRMGQYDTFRNPEKRDYLSLQIVKAKIKSQIQFLEQTKNPEVKDGIEFFRQSLLDIDKNPISHEARLGRRYFSEYAKLIPKRFGFQSRNQSNLRITKTKATDVINALLNYGYAVLAGEISKFVNGMGLDAYYGFYHKEHTGFQPLVYDVIEPFRWLVDYTVYKIANHQNNDQTIKLKDFAHNKSGQVLLSPDLVRRFLEMLERKFNSTRHYEFRHGAKTLDGLKNVQEITLAKIAVQNLAEFCIRKQVNLKL